MYIGLDWIYERGRHLARYLATALAATDGVEVLTPAECTGVIVAFRVRGWQAERALEELEHRAFVMARAIPAIDAIRASVGFFNTDAELDRLVGAVAELASHGPGDLPPRRILAMASGGPVDAPADRSPGAPVSGPKGNR
jgi:selenocysteine lyase/cysteine desulfurase